MFMSLVFSLLFTGSVFAADAPPVNEMPVYEQEVNSVLNLFNQAQLAPQYIRFKFNDVIRDKNAAMGKYERIANSRFFKAQQSVIRDFDKENSAAITQWRKANPKGDFNAFQKEIQTKRRAIQDDQNIRRTAHQLDMKTKRKEYDEFMKIRREEFGKKLSEYTKTYQAKMDEASGKTAPPAADASNPTVQEFKEIPKGQGIKLAPNKE